MSIYESMFVNAITSYVISIWMRRAAIDIDSWLPIYTHIYRATAYARSTRTPNAGVGGGVPYSIRNMLTLGACMQRQL